MTALARSYIYARDFACPPYDYPQPWRSQPATSAFFQDDDDGFGSSAECTHCSVDGSPSDVAGPGSTSIDNPAVDSALSDKEIELTRNMIYGNRIASADVLCGRSRVVERHYTAGSV